MTIAVTNSRWIRKDLHAANNAAFRDTFQLGEPNDTWTLEGTNLVCWVRPAPGHPTVILQMDNELGYIIVRDAKTRQIQFNVPDDVIDDVEPGTYYYDLLTIGLDGFRYRRMAGHFLVHQGISTP